MPKFTPKVQSHLPPAPWIYINDPSGDDNFRTGTLASQLARLIPKAVHLELSQTLTKSANILNLIRDPCYRDTVVIVSDNKTDLQEAEKQASSAVLKEASIKHGSNFASINLYTSNAGLELDKWGTNHHEFAVSPNCVTQVYQWLFTVLTVLEQLYLIPDKQMEEVDKQHDFKDFTYCPIAESRKHPRGAQLQFVVLILTKPEIGPNQQLKWEVADKTGVANFYFRYRGPTSQYTWDWVLALKPGDRKCLPRMSMVKIKERTMTTIIKAPFRVSGALIGGTGVIVRGVGNGLCKAGKKIKLGDHGEWVYEDEVVTDSKGRKVKISRLPRDDKYAKLVPIESKTEVKVFTEKGEKVWEDNDSVISTTAGSAIDEKQTKDFT